MASPQLENGYTRIANELLDALCFIDLSGSAWRCAVFIVRKTYGYKKKSDRISLSQFELGTGLTRVSVTRGLKELAEKRVIISNHGGYIVEYSINKDHSEWGSIKPVTSNRYDTKTSIIPVTKTSNRYDTHKRKKERKIISEANASAKSMPWNQKSDDYEEGVVDLDGDLTLVEEKKKSTRKYPNAPAIRKVFQEVLGRSPANWRINKTQLQSCENLYTERTLEKVRSALEFYKEHEGQEYCPTIHSPYDLDTKWTKLGEYKLKQT